MITHLVLSLPFRKRKYEIQIVARTGTIIIAKVVLFDVCLIVFKFLTTIALVCLSLINEQMFCFGLYSEYITEKLISIPVPYECPLTKVQWTNQQYDFLLTDTISVC